MDQDDKPQFKATLQLAAFDQETLDSVVKAVQDHLAGNGLEVQGKVKYERPLEYRTREEGKKTAKITRLRPMERMWEEQEVS